MILNALGEMPVNTTTLYNKDDQVTYALLHAMLQGDLTIAKTTLAADYGLTTYQINKYFATINADLQTISTEAPIFLDETQRGLWRAHGLTTYALQRLGLLYLQRSSAFLVFEYRFLYSNQLAKRDYIAKQAISTPVFYTVSKALEKQLRAQGFFTASGNFTDPEYTIRLHLFELYYTAYTGVATPFRSMNAPVERLLRLCADFIGRDLRPSQITKLSLFLKLWLLRVRNGGRLAQALLPAGLLDKPARQFMAKVQAALRNVNGIDDRETNYLYTFLVAQGFLPSRSHFKAAFPTASALSADFIASLTRQAQLLDPAHFDAEALKARLDQIHLQLTTFFGLFVK